MPNSKGFSARQRPAWLRALGRAEPPRRVHIGGYAYARTEIFKHDSWAATAVYKADSCADQPDTVVCKFNRVQPLFGIPLSWLGRVLAARESRALHQLAHVRDVPAPSGPIEADGRRLSNAVAHEFLEGHPLGVDERVDDDFFPRLQSLLSEIHRCGMAYVDLHKRENVLVGIDGRPNLIDFQISLQSSGRILWRIPPLPWLLRIFQRSDEFCLAKHVRNLRPDQLNQLGLAHYAKIPWWIRAHRTVAVPFRQTRRRILAWLRVRDPSGRSSTEVFPEHAVRLETQTSKSPT